MSRWRACVLAFFFALVACAGDPSTQLLVIVDSDLPEGQQPQTVHLSATLADVHMATLDADVAVHGLPLSFALVHGGGATGPLRVHVEGRDANGAVIARDAELSFVPDQVMVLRMDLYSRCKEVACGPQNTCTELGCVSQIQAGARVSTWRGSLGTLEPWRGDASSLPKDAGVTDAGDALRTTDGAAPDAQIDADAMITGADAEAKLDASTGIASLATCAVFPGNSVWNVNLAGQTASPESNTYISSWGANTPLSLQFGVTTGVIWSSVRDTQPAVPVELAKPNVRVNWPIPVSYALAESPSSRLIVVNTDKCTLYEAVGCEKISNAFVCESGAAVGLAGSWVRQPGSVMAQDSALALLPGLVRVDEIRSGAIDHALSMTMSSLQQGFVSPALNHIGGLSPSPNFAPMGVRLRLRASYSEAGASAEAKVVIRALKTHGVLVTHRGSSFGLLGERHPEWDKFDLQALTNIKASDFEVLAHGAINL